MKLITTLGALALLATSVIHGSSLDVQTEPTGVKILKNHTGTPDSKGVMETYTLDIPAFTRGVYYVSQWWPYGGNRVSFIPRWGMVRQRLRASALFCLLPVVPSGPLLGESLRRYLKISPARKNHLNGPIFHSPNSHPRLKKSSKPT